MLHAGAIGIARSHSRNWCMRPRGLILVTGPTGSGKSTTLGSLGQLHQRTGRPPHHHDRRPDRVLSLPQKIDDQPARSRRRRAEFFRSHSAGIAAGSGRDSGRRNARLGNDRSGDHRRRNGPHRVRTLHTNSAQGTVNRIIDAFPGNLQDQIRTQLIHGAASASWRKHCCRESAAAVSRPTRCWWSLRRRQLDSRKQDFPYQLGDSNGCQVRHAA